MVPLVRVGSGFAARVLVARLGSEGIMTQLRGAVDTPWPIGEVEVLVPSDDLEVACGLLLADEVEAAFDSTEATVDADDLDDVEPEGEADERSSSPLPVWAAALGVAVLVVFVLLRATGS